MLEKAIIIATTAHLGQVDKAGDPYILHPIRVMLLGKMGNEKICGILHDVVEDTNITLEYLKEEGFSDEILLALDALTKRHNEPYDEFIDRVLKNEIACKVKLSDLSDNMDLTRIKNPSNKDYERLEKYCKATNKILEEVAKKDTLSVKTTDIEAIRKWNKISIDIQSRIIQNVLCSTCGVTTIVNYTLHKDNSGILLKGNCKKCNNPVARIIEG